MMELNVTMPQMAKTARTPRPSFRVQAPRFTIKEPTTPRFRKSARFSQTEKLLRETSLLSNVPLSPHEVVHDYAGFLTIFELTEIFNFNEIYYIGRLSQKINPHVGLSHNRGFDDNNGNLITKINDHISYRYQIKQILGESDHAITTLSYDHKLCRNIVLKILSSKCSNYELPALKQLSQSRCAVHLYASFIFRNHIIMCEEVLGANVYSILSSNKDAATLNLARSVGKCLFSALNDCHNRKIFHGKVNLRNILVDPSQIHASFKLVDFSSCNKFENYKKTPKRLIERAPEELLVYKSSPDKIDIWNAALTLSNIVLGTPLITGKNPKAVIFEIRRISGEPPPQISSSCGKPDLLVMTADESQNKVVPQIPIEVNEEEEDDSYEEEDFEEEEEEEEKKGEVLIPKKRDLLKVFRDQNFTDVIMRCLKWVPEERPSAGQILTMPFFVGLPELKKGK